MLTRIRRSRSLTQDAYERIKAAIIANELSPGEQLKEEEMASRLGISSTPLREALARLEQEWLVTTIPHRGKFVSEITIESVRDLFEVRRKLECLAVDLALPALTQEDLDDLEAFFGEARDQTQQGGFTPSLWVESETRLHGLIVDRSGNQWLIRMLTALNDHIWRIRRFRVTTLGADTLRSFQEHLAIWEAIKARDVVETKKLIEQHLQRAARDLVAFLAEFEEQSPE
jgi:DNA-binding GntR family transcriptional regulator